MTEAGWLDSRDPPAMLQLVKGIATERKLRLFAVACCRRNRDFVESWYLRLAELTEKHVDGQATALELKVALDAAHDPDWIAGRAFEEAASLNAWDAAFAAADDSAYAAVQHLIRQMPPAEIDAARLGAEATEFSAQAALLRDVFGNPFKRSTLNESLFTDAVNSVARHIYDEGAFDRMAELAAALESSGCTDGEILNHCCEPGPHVRGCWVLDQVLGRK